MGRELDRRATRLPWARRRQLLYAGLWLVVVEVLGVMAVYALDSALAGLGLWIALLVPALAYLGALWCTWRCPACNAPLIVNAGPYQRVVFKLNAKNCPRCGALLR